MTSIRWLIETLWRSQFGCNYLKKKKLLLIFFCIFEIYVKLWIFFLKKMTFIADAFLILGTLKKIVIQKSCSRGPFNKQQGKRAETLLKFEPQHLYYIYWSLRRQLSWKTSLLGRSKIVRLFVNTSTADDKYFLLNREKLTEPIQILLSEK